MFIKSPQNLQRVAFQFRGTTDSGIGNIKITCATDSLSETLGIANVYYSSTVTATAPGTGTPGQAFYFDIPVADNIKWIKIQRGTTTGAAGGSATNVRIYRIAASTTSTTFTLPLDFISFTAKANTTGNSVDLNWRTTNEVNTKEFLIEKRTDNTEFTKIGTLASKNTSGIHNYSFIDNDVSSGNIYYRLKQIDFDGKFKYSDIVQVKVKSKLTLSAFPNPTTDALNLTFAPAKNALLKVMNLNGQVVLEKKLVNGTSIATLNTASLNPSMYLLVYENDGEQSNLKFVKK
jgi:hypothetical protein